METGTKRTERTTQAAGNSAGRIAWEGLTMLSIFTDAPTLESDTNQTWVNYGPKGNACVIHAKRPNTWRVEFFGFDTDGLPEVVAEFKGQRALTWILDNDGMTIDAPAVLNRYA